MRSTPTICLLVLLTGSPALAQPKWSDMEQAVAAFHSGEFRQSLKLLKRVAPSVRQPRERGRLHLYLGLNYAFLDKRGKARTAFVAALTHNPELELNPDRIRPDVVKLFNNVRTSLRGTVEVSGPARATVRVDGVVQGRIPLRFEAAIGRHHIEVRDSRGSSLLRKWVVVQRSRNTQVEVKAPPSPRRQVVEYKPGNTEPVPPPVQPPPAPPAANTDGGERKGRLWTWVAASGAVVFGGIGLGLILSARSDYEQYQTTEDRDRFFKLKDSIPRKYIASYVMFGIGGALAATAVVLYFYEGQQKETQRRSTVGLRIGATGVGFEF